MSGDEAARNRAREYDQRAIAAQSQYEKEYWKAKAQQLRGRRDYVPAPGDRASTGWSIFGWRIGKN
jgi:hypothetical protein